MYLEVHMFNEASRFSECVGIAMFPFNKLNKVNPEKPNDPVIT